MPKFSVRIISCTNDSQTTSVAGALGCFEEESSIRLLDGLNYLSEDELDKKEKGVLSKSFGRGHGSVGDQNYFIFSIENLPRAATLHLCLPEYLSHLQQSLRRAKASRGFYLPEAIRKSPLVEYARNTLRKSFEFYEKMAEAKIPGEDARFVLPLYTKTNIQTAGNARELCHLQQMTNKAGVPSIVKAVVNEMIALARERAPYLFEDFGFNREVLAWYPSAQLFAPASGMMGRLTKDYLNVDGQVVFLGWQSSFPEAVINELIDEAVTKKDETLLADLKHIHFEFLAPMSLACFHQSIRQRTWNQSVESIYEAAERAWEYAGVVIPPSIEKSQFAKEYYGINLEMLVLYKDLTEAGIPKSEAIGVLPHSLQVLNLIHINGWNALHSIGKRTCVEAQWEVREIATAMAKVIKQTLPSLGRWAEPQCVVYGGKCPEGKDCGYYKRQQS